MVSAQSDLIALDGYLATAYQHSGAATDLLAEGNTKAAELHMVAVAYAIANAQDSAAALGSDLGPLVGLWNNGTPAATLEVTPSVWSDYASPSAVGTSYTAGEASVAGSRRLMLAIGATTAAEATEVAQACMAGDQNSVLFRPMWEMNQGSWFPLWNQQALTAAEYKATWVTLVDAIRAVMPAAQFIWNQNASDGNNLPGRTSTDTFPGTSYCDFIGVDIYDDFGSAAEAHTQLLEVIAFAQSVGLPWCLPEWGLANNLDVPGFVSMLQSAEGCYLQSLFSEVGLTSGNGTDITKAPGSLAAYRAWVAASG